MKSKCNNAFILRLRRNMQKESEVMVMQEKRNEKQETQRADERIDQEFLDRNHQIRKAFARAKIDTYPKLYEKANAEYNLFYVSGLSANRIKEIQKHLLRTGRKGLPKYEENLKEMSRAGRRKTKQEKTLRERLGLVKKQIRLTDM